jgi:acylphosphatase
MIARTIRIEGKVQGVFFRDWAIEAARAIGVSGWVRNRRDGSVEVYAIGEPDLVERFTDRLREGSPASRVDRIDAQDADLHPIDGFTRKPTA